MIRFFFLEYNNELIATNEKILQNLIKENTYFKILSAQIVTKTSIFFSIKYQQNNTCKEYLMERMHWNKTR